MANVTKIESNLQELLKNFSEETFIYDLLSAYEKPKATITRLKKGTSNLSKNDNELIYKKNLYFKEASGADLHSVIDDLRNDEATYRHDPRFILVTDYKTLLAVDTKTEDTLDIEIKNLANHYTFFLPWAGMEKAQNQLENPADVKAAEKMAKLFDLIKKDNPSQDEKNIHALNIFLSRILFCYFAEDTGIFPENLFSKNVESHTSEDGESVAQYLDRLFEVLNTPLAKTSLNNPEYLKIFPYVNGGLFKEKIKSPMFNRQSRKMLIECGKGLDWSQINPDIFGSMMQAVVHPEQRSGMGMHYTSVPNIMKVVEALFLNELGQEFEKNKENKNKLEKLLKRLENIKIFDPACGSGNFLIISYKELRRLEMKIFKQLQELNPQSSLMLSRVNLSQFYGIELDDFAHEIAALSLWLAEHQMNVEFKAEFGETNPPLPLKEGGNVVCGNATRLNWEEVCPKNKDAEIYLLGNPPYLGFLQQGKEQKADMDYVFGGLKTIKKLDYISCWFFKGAKFVRGANSKLAFVSTNSLCQGEQVALFWPHILVRGLEIGFAHLSFKWSNSAKNSAIVTCIIVGLRNTSQENKYLFKDSRVIAVRNINAYLAETKDIYIIKHNNPLSDLPKISLGSSAYDGGYLMVAKEEYYEIIRQFPEAKKLMRRFVGSAEFLHGNERYCIWATENQAKDALTIPPIAERFEKVREFREKSNRKQTKQTAGTPYAFTENRHIDKPSIVIPIHFSEKREYFVCGFLDGSQIIPNSARAIYNPEPYVFAILSSRLHMTWVRAVAGQLETRLRYSAGVCYNGFPFPPISNDLKETIAMHVYCVLEERERHSEKTMAELYDPEKMPDGLLEAHQNLDMTVENCYRSKPFESDEERLEYLFKLYEKITHKEQGEACQI